MNFEGDRSPLAQEGPNNEGAPGRVSGNPEENAWIQIWMSFVETFRVAPLFVQRNLVGLCCIFFVFGISQIYLKSFLGAMNLNESGKLIGQFMQTFSSMIQYMFLMLYVPLRLHEQHFRLPKKSIWRFTQETAIPLTVEGLRAMVSIILWGLLFIIPGIFKYIRYTFVLFVVFFDTEYKAGNRCALKRSNELIKGLTFPLFLIFVGQFIIDIGGETLASKLSSGSDVSALVLSLIVHFIIAVVFLMELSILYRMRAGRDQV